MSEMTAGITKANDGLDGIRWNILGQTYTPKQLSENCFSWHASIPAEAFVPPHVHPHQDEFIYMLQGRLDFMLDGADAFAEPGDLVRLPMGQAHGIFNKSGQDVQCLFWVSPSRRLYDLFWAIHDLGPGADPAALVALSAKHEVDFLPPPDAG